MRAFQRRLYTERMKVYRALASDVNTFVSVPGCEAIPCHRRTTSNFDQPRSFAGQLNSDNALTSDEAHFKEGFDVRAEDKVFLFKPATPAKGLWFTVAGDPEEKERIPRGKAFITIGTRPRIDTARVWTE